MEARVIPTRTGSVFVRQDGIACYQAAGKRDHHEQDARENLAACRQLVGSKRVPVLVDMREAGSMTRQARQAYAGEADFATAQALLVGSAFSRIVANLFMRVSPPDQPTKMFSSEQEAGGWLRGFSPDGNK